MSSKYGLRNMVRWTVRRPGGSRFSSQINRRAAARTIQRAMRSKLMNMRRKKNVKSGVGITTQHDQRRIYTKKYMPKGKKIRWKSFVRKVHAVSEKELGARQVVFNKSVETSNTDPVKHTVGSIYLYSQRSSDSWGNDLNSISALENSTNPTAAAGDTISKSTKFLFQSGILDVTFRNTSQYRDPTNGLQLDYRAKMEVDIYEATVRGDCDDAVANLVGFLSVLARNAMNTDVIGGAPADNQINYDKRGVTPFEMSYSLSRYGVKILKKTKYMVPNGETFTYQIRDPKRRSINKKDMEEQGGFNRPGWTRIVYWVAKLVPGLSIGTEVGFFKESLSVGFTRKYMYKIEGVNEDRTYYASQ